MPSPYIAGAIRPTDNGAAGNQNNHPCALPADIEPDELLFIDCYFGTTQPSMTVPGGWTQFLTGGVAGAIFYRGLWRLADGSETDLVIATVNATRSSFFARRIRNHDRRAPTGTAWNAPGPTTQLNYPNHVPPHGLADYLWIITFGSQGGSGPSAAYPSPYEHILDGAITGIGPIGTADRQRRAASEDPANTNLDVAGNNTALTIGIYGGIYPLSGSKLPRLRH